MDAECGWCEMGVGVSGVEEEEFSAGSKGNVGHGLFHKRLSNVVVKTLRESGTLNCGGTYKCPRARALLIGTLILGERVWDVGTVVSGWRYRPDSLSSATVSANLPACLQGRTTPPPQRRETHKEAENSRPSINVVNVYLGGLRVQPHARMLHCKSERPIPLGSFHNHNSCV